MVLMQRMCKSADMSIDTVLIPPRTNDKPFDLMKLDGKATTGLSPNKTNWANPIAKGPYYG